MHVYRMEVSGISLVHIYRMEVSGITLYVESD